MIRSSISSRSILSTLTKLHRPFSSTSCSSSFSYNVSSQRCNSRGLLKVIAGVFPKRCGTAMAMSSSASSVPNLNSMERHSEVQLLPATEDEHDGVIVEMHRPIESQAFASLLRSSISHWIQLGKRSVWLKLPIENANLVDAAVKEGFYYHHAEPNYLMLARWLPETENMLPANASHRVGVGAFVVNEKKEVLVVQEKNGMLRKLGVWKFPTGVANEGEDIGEAAVREVKEETSIDTKFLEVLTFRQSHNAFFQKSDLYFVCFLEPSSFDIQIQESEILAAKVKFNLYYSSVKFSQGFGSPREEWHVKKIGCVDVPHWSNGVANEGEDISDAVVREVKEETRIDTKFQEVLTFRQSHNAFFQKSDLYFVCFLEPSSFDIQIQESEILAAKWMSFEEYAAQPFVQKHELLRYVTKICSAKMEGKYRGFSGVPIKASFRPANDCLFLSSDTPIEH